MSILDSTTQIIQLINQLQRPVSMTDVVGHLHFPKSTASRVLKQMELYGFLERNPETLCYAPGLMLLEAAHWVRTQNSLTDQMEQALRIICANTGHTGYISMLDKNDVLVLRVVHGLHALRVVTVPGTRSPAYATSTGRVLLARFSHDQLLKRFPDEQLPPAGEHSPQSRLQLFSQLNDIHRQGWAVAINEAVAGAASVSCSVHDPISSETLAFCLTFPAAMASEQQIHDLAITIEQQASDIGRRLGDPFWTTTLR